MFTVKNISTNAILLILAMMFAQIGLAETSGGRQLNHPHVRIYTEGLVKQNIKLSENDWDAIILAVDYSLVRVQAALDSLDEETYDEAIVGIKSAMHLLNLVKIATPTYEIHEQSPNGEKHIRYVQSLNIVSLDARDDERVIDVPLLAAFLENAKTALLLKDNTNAKLFLLNAQESAVYAD